MGKTAMQEKPHNKRPKYLGKLLDTTFSKDSSLNPKHKYFRTCCIMSIISCNYRAFLRVTAQKRKFSIKDFFSKCDQIYWPDPLHKTNEVFIKDFVSKCDQIQSFLQI